jgi:two-component system NtrC family response regulator
MNDFKILIVDDEAPQREILSGFLEKKKFHTKQARNVATALAFLKADHFDLIFTDFRMPGGTGVELLQEVKMNNPETAVVLMTAFGTIEGAVAAMKAGAYDYLTKPVDLEEVLLLIRRAAERRNLISENRLLKEQLAGRYSFEGIVSQSGAMQGVLSTAVRVAQSRASVLIRGESGTGKELIARAIHFNSERKTKPFLAVNCAALNENLLESELFGHEKGAFTGAEKARRGRFELADGGTLFLDEIGDISLPVQVKLLRVLQEQQFERVGGSESIRVDVRMLAATNKNLEQMIARGAFREDLLYRLNVVTINIPPLRDRRDDIAPLLESALERFSAENGSKKVAFSREAWNHLLRYDYPGNVRELENIIQRAVVLSRGEFITTEELPPSVQSLKPEQDIAESSGHLTLPERVERLEKEMVTEALRISGNNQSKAAAALGISERNLRYKLRKWGVK